MHGHAEQLIEELRRERTVTEVNIPEGRPACSPRAYALTYCTDHTPPNYLYWIQSWGAGYKGCG